MLYHAGLEDLNHHGPSSKDIFIFDECDDFLFEETKLFDSTIGKNSCICFTATPGGESNSNKTEAMILKHLNFKVICGDDNEESQVKLQVDMQIDDASLFDEITKAALERSVLVYCDEEMAIKINSLP